MAGLLAEEALDVTLRRAAASGRSRLASSGAFDAFPTAPVLTGFSQRRRGAGHAVPRRVVVCSAEQGERGDDAQHFGLPLGTSLIEDRGQLASDGARLDANALA